MQYIGNYIYKFSFFMHFLVILMQNNSKHGKEKLNGQKKQKEQFEILKNRAESAKLLYMFDLTLEEFALREFVR